MARYSNSVVSQTAELAGVNSTTTVNGYIGAWTGSSTAGFRLRRVKVGMRTTTAIVPTSQQVSVAVYRQTVAPSGTGLASAVLGQAMETWTPADPTTGMIVTTATSIGTTGPTLASQPIDTMTFNTASFLDVPWDFTEELVCAIGTANGFAFVNIGQTLPAGHFITLTTTIEV